jgi:hypothetical protein
MSSSPTAANAEIHSIPIPRTTHVSESGGTKNKVENRGMFFSTQKQAATAPHSPRIPPQLHHKNTTPKTPNLPKPPSKTP